MNENYGIIAIVGICAIIILFGILKSKTYIIINFVIRMITCLALIYLVNEILASNNIDLHVGLNAVSALTTGSLGLCGIALLYGILAVQIL